MSVILDALQKAQAEPQEHPNPPVGPVPRTPETAEEPPVPAPIVGKRNVRARPVLFAMLVLSLLLTVVLAGSAFFIVASRIQRENAQGAPAAKTNQPLRGKASAGAPEPGRIAELPPPVPIQELAFAKAKAPALAAADAAPSSSYQLGSIVCDSSDCRATINGRAMRVGDKMNDYRIIEITIVSVTMQKPGEPPLVVSLRD